MMSLQSILPYSFEKKHLKLCKLHCCETNECVCSKSQCFPSRKVNQLSWKVWAEIFDLTNLLIFASWQHIAYLHIKYLHAGIQVVGPDTVIGARSLSCLSFLLLSLFPTFAISVCREVHTTSQLVNTPLPLRCWNVVLPYLVDLRGRLFSTSTSGNHPYISLWKRRPKDFSVLILFLSYWACWRTNRLARCDKHGCFHWIENNNRVWHNEEKSYLLVILKFLFILLPIRNLIKVDGL